MNQPVDDPSEDLTQPSETGNMPCVFCRNMDIELMACDDADIYDLASKIPDAAGSALLNPKTGYLHHPTYQSLEECSCKVCKAMVIEIEHYLCNDISLFWTSRLGFISSRLASKHSQIYMHFPVDRGCGGREIDISCWSGFFDSQGRPQDLDKIGYPRGPDYEAPTGTEDEDDPYILPRSFVIGKIGVRFSGPTDCEHDAIKKEGKMLLEDKAEASENAQPRKRFKIRHLKKGWDIADDPLSDAAIATVTDWMSCCDETHDLCKPKADMLIMPTRLIDIGSQDPFYHPRLVYTTEAE